MRCQKEAGGGLCSVTGGSTSLLVMSLCMIPGLFTDVHASNPCLSFMSACKTCHARCMGLAFYYTVLSRHSSFQEMEEAFAKSSKTTFDVNDVSLVASRKIGKINETILFRVYSSQLLHSRALMHLTNQGWMRQLADYPQFLAVWRIYDISSTFEKFAGLPTLFLHTEDDVSSLAMWWCQVHLSYASFLSSRQAVLAKMTN